MVTRFRPRPLVPPVDLDLAIRLEHLLPGRFFSLSTWCEGLLTHIDGPRHARARAGA